MTTVRDVLDLPIMSEAQLIAGATGMDRPVRLVHVVDIPDIMQWISPQMLLMTTGYGKFQWATIIAELYGQQLSGVMVAFGPYIQAIPQEAIVEADRLGFPIIVLPWDLPFVKITEAVHQMVIKDQFSVMAHINRLQTQMVQAAVQSRSLTQLCRILSSLVNVPLDVIDSDGVSLLHDLVAMEKYIQFPIQSFSGYGHYLRVERTQPLEDWQVHIFEHMALVIGLWLLREEVAARTEARLQSSILDLALHGDQYALSHDMALIERAKLLGFNVHRRHHLLLVSLQSESSLHGAQRTFESIPHIEDMMRKYLRTWNILTTRIQENIVVVLPQHSSLTLSSLNNKLTAIFQKYPHLIAIFTDAVDTSHLAYTYQIALRALPLGDFTNRVVHLNSLLFPRLIAELPVDVMQTLVGLTWQRITDPILRHTLRVFVENHGSRSETAEMLKIHRNTLRYRLQQIEQILDHELNPAYVLELAFMFRWMKTQGL
ncbi:PucR family transcriptional regulator [Sulfobacillus thermosulfidooxidans]|uniref:PucR family transcriptional regulator n=1 Tax=Sulfobacillus thermosulfidooxidans TaxID=28034 RepID=UPI0012FD3476|nr:PucR family transcriptional regulator [Sulfobacillus thermosulfidooxidans]